MTTEIKAVRSSFASQLSRGVPMDELLLQMVEALRDGFMLDAAELWLCEGSSLRLAAAEPRRERKPISITPAEETIAANVHVSSASWAKVWLPALLEESARCEWSRTAMERGSTASCRQAPAAPTRPRSSAPIPRHDRRLSTHSTVAVHAGRALLVAS